MPGPKAPFDWDKNERKELLFTQIVGSDVNPFLTNRANIKPDKFGRGGVSYEKKELWETKILPTLSKDDAFAGVTMPEYQAVLNFVDRVVKANKHLYTSGLEQAEPAAAGTEGTKDETFTAYQQVSSQRTFECCPAHCCERPRAAAC